MAIENYMVWIWLAVFVISLIVEAASQDLLSIWFGLGSLAALCVSAILPFWGEIIVFLVVSTAALIATRPIVKKLMARQTRKTNSDDFIGKRVKCITEIDKYDAGEVKLNGVVYTAILPENQYEPIEKDSIVEVIAMKGNKVVVKAIENEGDLK